MCLRQRGLCRTPRTAARASPLLVSRRYVANSTRASQRRAAARRSQSARNRTIRPNSVYVAALHYSSQCFSAQKSLLDAVDFVPDAPAAGKRPNLRRFSLLQLYHEVGVSAPPGTTTTSWAPAPLVTVKECPRHSLRRRLPSRSQRLLSRGCPVRPGSCTRPTRRSSRR